MTLLVHVRTMGKSIRVGQTFPSYISHFSALVSQLSSKMENKILAASSSDYDYDLFLGYCKEFEHRQSDSDNRSKVLSLEPDAAADTEQLEKALNSSPNILSIQLGGHLKQETATIFNYKTFEKILQLIAKYCRGKLECLTIFFSHSVEEEDENGGVSEKLDDRESHPHTEAWDAFVDAVSPTIRHLIFSGVVSPYKVPYFALKKLLDNAPNLENIEGSFSKKLMISTPKDFLYLEDAETPYIISLEIDMKNLPEKSNLSDLREFKNLRHLKITFEDGNQFPDILDFSSLQNLWSLIITPNENGDDEHSEAISWERVGVNLNPVDLKFPSACKLRTLVLRGLYINPNFFQSLPQVLPMLIDLNYLVAHNRLKDFDLSPLKKLKRMQYLYLWLPCNLYADDVIPFLKIQEHRFLLGLSNMQDDCNKAKESIQKILEFLQDEEWLRRRRDKFSLTIEYPVEQNEKDPFLFLDKWEDCFSEVAKTEETWTGILNGKTFTEHEIMFEILGKYLEEEKESCVD